MLATGTYASVHGIVSNRWFNQKGEAVESDSDTAQNAAVFSPTGLYSYGKSARNILVDTFSDQLMLHSYNDAKNTVWSLSLKGRAAITMAGRLGRAIWHDSKTQTFTSSKAYFSTLPQWVRAFKKETNKGIYVETSLSKTSAPPMISPLQTIIPLVAFLLLSID